MARAMAREDRGQRTLLQRNRPEHLGKFERLQLVEDLWDEFAAESSYESRSEVLDELSNAAPHGATCTPARRKA